jgi:hypothetical protein
MCLSPRAPAGWLAGTIHEATKFYSNVPSPSLSLLRCLLPQLGNTTLAFATFRLAASNGWTGHQLPLWARRALQALPPALYAAAAAALLLEGSKDDLPPAARAGALLVAPFAGLQAGGTVGASVEASGAKSAPAASALGLEDLGEGLDSDAAFGAKLLALSLALSYAVK